MRTKRVPTSEEQETLPAFGPLYEAEYKKQPPERQHYVYRFNCVKDAKQYLRKELINSILLGTLEGYAKQTRNFAQWAANNWHVAPPRESDEERNPVGSYADRYVRDRSKAYSSIADLVAASKSVEGRTITGAMGAGGRTPKEGSRERGTPTAVAVSHGPAPTPPVSSTSRSIERRIVTRLRPS